MWPNPKFPADLVTFTEENLNGKHHFLCSATNSQYTKHKDLFIDGDLISSRLPLTAEKTLALKIV